MTRAHHGARFALIAAILLLTCGISRGAEQYASPAAVFTAIPAALRTPPDGKWTVQQTFGVNEWLRLHVEGKPIAAVFEFARVGKSMGQAAAHGTCPRDMPKELKDLYFEGLFSDASDVAKLKKAKRGDVFTCTGVIKNAHIAIRPSANELFFTVTIDHAILKP